MAENGASVSSKKPWVEDEDILDTQKDDRPLTAHSILALCRQAIREERRAKKEDMAALGCRIDNKLCAQRSQSGKATWERSLRRLTEHRRGVELVPQRASQGLAAPEGGDEAVVRPAAPPMAWRRTRPQNGFVVISWNLQRAGIGLLKMMAEELELAADWGSVAIQELLAPSSDEVNWSEVGENEAVARQVRGHPLLFGPTGVAGLLRRRWAPSVRAVWSRGCATVVAIGAGDHGSALVFPRQGCLLKTSSPPWVSPNRCCRLWLMGEGSPSRLGNGFQHGARRDDWSEVRGS